MGVLSREVRPLFLIILQWWLSEAQDVATRKETPATVKGSRDEQSGDWQAAAHI
jgi:hypothetical protein